MLCRETEKRNHPRVGAAREGGGHSEGEGEGLACQQREGAPGTAPWDTGTPFFALGRCPGSSAQQTHGDTANGMVQAPHASHQHLLKVYQLSLGGSKAFPLLILQGFKCWQRKGLRGEWG